MKKLNKVDICITLAFFAVGVVTRFPFIEQYQSHWDGPQYSIAIVAFSLEEHTPAPPGYPLYIFFGKIFSFFLHDPFRSIVAVSVFFSGLSAAMFFIIGTILFRRSVGVVASVLSLSAPTFYFFGLTAYPYGGIPAIALLTAFAVYSCIRKTKGGIFLGTAFAFALGFRPQEAPQIFPLFMLGFFYLKKRERFLACLSLIGGLFFWLIPFMVVVGGVERYQKNLMQFFSEGAIAPLSLVTAWQHILRMGKGAFLTLGFSIGFLLYYCSKLQTFWDSLFSKHFNGRIVQLFLVWATPPLLVNMLIRSDHAGYQMTYLSALVLLVSYSIWRIFRKYMRLLVLTLFLLTGSNLWLFFRDRDPHFLKSYTPTSFHYSEIRKNDLLLAEKVAYIKNNFSQDKTLVITSGALWRPYMYHLPEYQVWNLDRLFTTDPKFRDIIRKGQNWRRIEYKSGDALFTVPNNTSLFVFVDDNICRASPFPYLTIVQLARGGCIGILSVREGEQYTYGYMIFEKSS